jgi:hypothetical protein
MTMPSDPAVSACLGSYQITDFSVNRLDRAAANQSHNAMNHSKKRFLLWLFVWLESIVQFSLALNQPARPH